MNVNDQVTEMLKNIGIGQVMVIKHKSIGKVCGGYAKLSTIATSIRVHGGATSRYLHTVVDRDRVIVVRLAYDDPKPGRDYDERLKNEY